MSKTIDLLKKKLWSTLGFEFFDTENNTIAGIEVMKRLRKGQANSKNYSVLIEVEFIKIYEYIFIVSTCNFYF